MGIRQSTCHVGRVAAVDHEVVVAICDEDGVGDDRQVVGLASSGVADGLELSDAGLYGDSLVAGVGAFLEAVQVVGRGVFPSGVRGKNKKFLGSLRVSAALRYAPPTIVAILSMPPPPRGPVPARIMRRTSWGACSATI